MANMGYCRFRNTRSDLNDCLEALNGDRLLSSDEARAGCRMFTEFLGFCREHLIIADYDGDGIRSLFDGLTEKEDERNE